MKGLEQSVQNVPEASVVGKKPNSALEKFESSLESQNKQDSFDAQLDRIEDSVYQSTYEERIACTPRENSERGTWAGERGESEYRPNDPEVQKSMKERGVEGIPYKDGIVDFSGVSEATVEIEHMTDQRQGKGGNFEQCNTKLAEEWNREGHGGRDDWTPRDVENWRKEDGYTWHERNDRKTCDLVPTEIHESCGHLGGVSECKKDMKSKEVVFDE